VVRRVLRGRRAVVACRGGSCLARHRHGCTFLALALPNTPPFRAHLRSPLPSHRNTTHRTATPSRPILITIMTGYWSRRTSVAPAFECVCVLSAISALHHRRLARHLCSAMPLYALSANALAASTDVEGASLRRESLARLSEDSSPAPYYSHG
jgi:hypothetical protein